MNKAIANANDRVNLELLHFSPRGAAVALALACGDGTIAARRRLWRPDVALFGQERDAPRAALAAAQLDHVHVGGLEDLEPLAVTRDRPAGVMTLPAGLETAEDPVDLLRRLAAGLEDGGCLSVSFVPSNSAELIAALIAGRLDQAESVLGPAPRRLLTLERLAEYAAAAGLHEAGARPLMANPAEAKRLAIGLAALIAQGPQADAIATRLIAARWLLRLIKHAPRRLWLQSMVLKPVGGVNEVRINQPFSFLGAEAGVNTRIEERTASFAGVPDTPRIFIWQRPILTYEHHIRPLKQIRGLGFVQITEFDDHPLVWPLIAENKYLNYRGVHAVQTSTPALESLYREWNPEVALFPNAMAEVPPPRPSRDPAAPIVIFFGALNRDKDWAPILPALNRVLAAATRPVRMVILHDRKLFDAITHPGKQFHPTTTYPEYLALMGQADIALLPLEPGLFNGMKSDLKFLECAANGAVALASPTVYENSIRDGETGVLFRSPEAFEAELTALITNDTRRAALSAAARAWLCDGRLMWQQTARRLAWYRDLCDRRAMLDAALVARVPEVGD